MTFHKGFKGRTFISVLPPAVGRRVAASPLEKPEEAGGTAGLFFVSREVSPAMTGTKLHLRPEIVTPRMRLRPLAPARRGARRALRQRRAGRARRRRSIPHPYPPGAAEAFIERVTAPGAADFNWALDTGADDENGLVGLIGMRPGGEGAAEIGYWVAPAFWNTGYASEAVEGLVAEAARSGCARADRRRSSRTTRPRRGC